MCLLCCTGCASVDSGVQHTDLDGLPVCDTWMSQRSHNFVRQVAHQQNREGRRNGKNFLLAFVRGNGLKPDREHCIHKHLFGHCWDIFGVNVLSGRRTFHSALFDSHFGCMGYEDDISI